MLINPRIWNNRVKKIESNVDNCPGFSEKRYQMICQIQKYLKEGCSYREICNQRAPTDGFAEQNGRDAERADLTYIY